MGYLPRGPDRDRPLAPRPPPPRSGPWVGPCIRHGAAISSFGTRARTRARWVGLVRGPLQVARTVRRARSGLRVPAGRWSAVAGGRETAIRPRSGSGGPAFSVWWGGGEPAIRSADQSPAALMDRPMMGPAQQRQVVQIGGATIQPMPPMMALAPGQGPRTAREDAATVAHRRGLPLGRGDDAGAAADIQGPAGSPTQDRGQLGQHGPEQSLETRPRGSWGLPPGQWAPASGGWRLTTPGSPWRHRPAAGTPRGPAARPRPSPHLVCPAGPAGCSGR
jgi:hypothetical protein